MRGKLQFVTLALGAATAVNSHAQGTLSWGNAIGTTITGVRAPIYGVSNDRQAPLTGNSPTGVPAGTTDYGGAPLLAGTGFTAGLFVGTSPSAVQATLVARDMTTFRTGTAAGFMNPRIVTIQGILPGSPAFVQIRAWDNRGGTVTSWAAVMGDPSLAHGSSAVFQTDNLGGTDPLGMMHQTPQTLGIRSFNMPSPEPSLIALGAVAFGGLLLCRRK